MVRDAFASVGGMMMDDDDDVHTYTGFLTDLESTLESSKAVLEGLVGMYVCDPSHVLSFSGDACMIISSSSSCIYHHHHTQVLKPLYPVLITVQLLNITR